MWGVWGGGGRAASSLVEVECVAKSYQLTMLVILPGSPSGGFDDVAECLYEEVPGTAGGNFAAQPPLPNQPLPPAIPAPRMPPSKTPSHHPPPNFRPPLPPGKECREGSGSVQGNTFALIQLMLSPPLPLLFPSSSPPLPLPLALSVCCRGS